MVGLAIEASDMAAELGCKAHAFNGGLQFGWDVAEEVEGPGLSDFEQAREVGRGGLLQVKADSIGIGKFIANVDRALFL